MGIRTSKRQKRAWEEAEGSDGEAEAERQRKEQEEREQDQREKEEFAERLRLRDEERTRKIMQAKLSKEEIEVFAQLLPVHRKSSCVLCCWGDIGLTPPVV